MTTRGVHWHEGMFLWPQQLQAAERFYLSQLERQHRWDVHHNWGLRLLVWDEAALVNHRFAVKELLARMKDGTPIAVPDDGPLSPLDVTEALTRGETTVYLALPKIQPHQPNVGERQAKPTGDEPERRYFLETQDLEDENTGTDAVPIPVRFYNAKLLTSSQDLSGYETIPIARLTKAAAETPPKLDETYIPPILSCDAWKPLYAGILQALYDRLGRKMDLISKQIASRNISFDTHNAGDGLLLSQLHSLNRAYAALASLVFAEGVHPLEGYTELCRIAGQLAVFSGEKRAPTLPQYDHDDLGGCFYRVKQYIDSIDISEPSYEERPFVGKGPRIQVALEPKWLEPIWQMFVGVQSDLTAEECVRVLTRQGPLDMKIGSATNVDAIYDRGSQGLEFTACQKPPRALPSAPGLVYFQINRLAQQEEWNNVQKSLSLAIRLNQFRVVGSIEGLQKITIRAGGDTRSMQFTLFTVTGE